MFKALRGGMSELVTAIERRLPAGSVRLQSGARALSLENGTWRIACDSGTLGASAVIVASPAYVASRLVSGTDPQLGSLCSEIPYASTVSVALAWPRARVAHPLAGSGFVVSRRHSRLRMTACTWVSSKWEHRAAPGTVLLRVFLGGIADPEVVTLADADVVDIAVREVSSVLNVTGAPELARIYRWPNAGAQHNVGHAERVARIESRLAALPGLFVGGSGFRSIGLPDCIADGRGAAGRAAAFVALRSN
jgi:protoporphyrinogen/coproporphyrinogen III oxidase